jgi:hypothetical protein
LWIVIVRRTSRARIADVETIVCRAANRIAVRAVTSQNWGETDAAAGRASSAAASTAPESTTPSQGAAELLPRSGQAAAERPGGTAEANGGLVERQPLEVAEDDRRAEGLRQAVDLDVQDLGLVAVEHGLIGGRSRRAGRGASIVIEHDVHDVPLFEAAPACEVRPGLACGAECDATEPGGESIGVAERAGLPGQDEEGGLEGVLGELVVAHELSADAQDHRAMAGNQRGEGGLVSPPDEPLEELAVGETRERTVLEERAELTGQ